MNIHDHQTVLRQHSKRAKDISCRHYLMKTLLIETDQIYCYDNDGKMIACGDTGEDAGTPKLAGPAGCRFEKRGDLVFDNVTGALWPRNASPAEFALSWDEARAYAAAMDSRKEHGAEGWQVPSRRLLFSLISHQYINPALPKDHPFENVFTGYYWTSDACSRLPGQVWYIHMGGGRVTRANKSDSAMLLPVCPPKAPPDASLECPFTLLGETVEDNRTGLIWTRDAGLSPRLQSWDEALDYVKSINSQGYCGSRKWRLPNIRELDSLVDVFRHSPALPMGHPFINVQDAYWSSTTSVFESRYAWVLYFQDGMVGVGFKAGLDFSVWPVRSA